MYLVLGGACCTVCKQRRGVCQGGKGKKGWEFQPRTLPGNTDTDGTPGSHTTTLFQMGGEGGERKRDTAMKPTDRQLSSLTNTSTGTPYRRLNDATESLAWSRKCRVSSPPALGKTPPPPAAAFSGSDGAMPTAAAAGGGREEYGGGSWYGYGGGSEGLEEGGIWQ